jgi:membrane-associated phospholipid phosphatase
MKLFYLPKTFIFEQLIQPERMYRLLMIMTCCSLVSVLHGQTPVRDTIAHVRIPVIKQYYLPAGLFAGSLILQTDHIKQKIQNYFPDTDTSVDDWLKFMPSVQIYAFDAMGFPHRSSVFDQTKNLLVSHLVTSGVVQLLKSTTGVKRPSGGVHSFPSGHTSFAFVGATALYLEFRDTRPLLAYSGFAIATATGILRITNNAHWLPDVMAGAAIGMLVTELVYELDPLRFIHPFSKKCKLSLVTDPTSTRLCLNISI